jgi:hypothetical protein
MFVLMLAVLVLWVVRAIRRPDTRQKAADNILIIVAFLVLLLDGVTTLSPVGQRTTHIAVAAILVGTFGKLVWNAKPWR